MMWVDTYSLVRRACVRHALYISLSSGCSWMITGGGCNTIYDICMYVYVEAKRLVLFIDM
jgi:hypothetical protein